MALIKCKECGEEISSGADVCPNCGYKISKKPPPIAGFGCLFLIIFLGGYALFSNVSNKVKFNDIERIDGYFYGNTKIFTYYVEDIDFIKIEKHAKSKYKGFDGMTIVAYYFNDRLNIPNYIDENTVFDKEYNKYCIGYYRKYPNGVEKFYQYPFSQ